MKLVTRKFYMSTGRNYKAVRIDQDSQGMRFIVTDGVRDIMLRGWDEKTKWIFADNLGNDLGVVQDFINEFGYGDISANSFYAKILQAGKFGHVDIMRTTAPWVFGNKAGYGYG